MTELYEVLAGAIGLVVDVFDYVKVIADVLAAHGIFICWVVFWIWLARWPDLRTWLRQGAWVSVLLLYVAVALTWGLCSEPSWSFTAKADGFWLSICGKFVSLAIWIGVAFLCGAIQDYMGWTPPAVQIAGPPDAEPQPSSNHDH